MQTETVAKLEEKEEDAHFIQTHTHTRAAEAEGT